MGSWLSEFKALALRNAELLRVLARDYGSPDSPLVDVLWLEFEGSPLLELACAADGQGFDLDETQPDQKGGLIRDLTAEPPFASLVNTSLRAASVITWPIPADEDDGPPLDFPVGIHLQFERGDSWILNVGDEVELFDAEPPFWHDPLYALSEWPTEDSRWGEGNAPEPPGNRWWMLATPVPLPFHERARAFFERLFSR